MCECHMDKWSYGLLKRTDTLSGVFLTVEMSIGQSLWSLIVRFDMIGNRNEAIETRTSAIQ